MNSEGKIQLRWYTGLTVPDSSGQRRIVGPTLQYREQISPYGDWSDWQPVPFVSELS